MQFQYSGSEIETPPSLSVVDMIDATNCTSSALQKIQLVEGTPVYEHWLHPVLPTTTSLYLFSLENHDKFMAGNAKPLLVQKGPYVFEESIERANVVHHPHNSSVTYQTRYVKIWNPHQ